MNQDSAALQPSLDPLVPDAIDEVTQTQAAQQVVLDDKTKALAGLSSDEGWLTLAAQMQADIDNLFAGKSMNFDTNTSMEVIGQKYLVNVGVANKLQEYIDQVNNARDAAIKAIQDKQNVVDTTGAA